MAANGMNKVILIGNLGADPDFRVSPSGMMVCNLRLATTESVKTKDGTWQDKTEWHRLAVFGKTAEVCSKHLSKGFKLAVEGRLQTRSWEDKEGNKRYATEVVGDRVIFLSSAEKGGRHHDPSPQEPGASLGDDDIPF